MKIEKAIAIICIMVLSIFMIMYEKKVNELSKTKEQVEILQRDRDYLLNEIAINVKESR